MGGKRAFTLIELSIVMVVVGLITVSVLYGRGLVREAQLQALLKQYRLYTGAISTFSSQYGALPGDINSSRFGLVGGCDGTDNFGDGDGLIEDSSGGIANYNSEIACFWANLTSPGQELIPGLYDGHEGAASATTNDVVGDNMPEMDFSEFGWGVFFESSENFLVTGVVGSQADDGYDTAVVFSPLDAFNIDSKIDDGKPETGILRSRGTGDNNPNAAASTNAGISTTVCNNSDDNSYQVSSPPTAALCNLRFGISLF